MLRTDRSRRAYGERTLARDDERACVRASERISSPLEACETSSLRSKRDTRSSSSKRKKERKEEEERKRERKREEKMGDEL